jgi:hypothetical protein
VIELAVERVRPGHVLVLPRGATHVVTEVKTYEDGSYLVVYAASEEVSFENKARDRGGYRTITRTVERGLAVNYPGEKVALESDRCDWPWLNEARERLAAAERERNAHNILRISPTMAKYADPPPRPT